MLGNIIFIGELFKNNIIQRGIMEVCIAHLLKDLAHASEEYVEGLCSLLSTVAHDPHSITSM